MSTSTAGPGNPVTVSAGAPTTIAPPAPVTPSNGVDEFVFKAKLAEQAERYEEMADFMKKAAEKKNIELSLEERNLLSVAYKNVVGARRTSWRTLYKLECKEKLKTDQSRKDGKDDEAKKSEPYAACCRDYRVKVERELLGVCHDILNLIHTHILPKANADLARAIPAIINTAQNYKERAVEALEKDLQQQLEEFEQKNHYQCKITNGESVVFFFKMIGDYYRYIAEISVDNESERSGAACRSLSAYFVATDIAKTHLQPTHPMRLGLALNYSVFYYEIMSKPDRACHLAKNAFDDAIGEMNQLQADTYRDSTLIMQLLRDNLTLWTSEQNEDDQPDPR